MRLSTRFQRLAALLLATAALSSPALAAEPLYEDVSATHLPVGDLEGLSMDAAMADVDGDGDLDILIANEWRPNILLINDGTGRFSNESAARLPQVNRDSEDVGFADFDGDGDVDAVIVTEDDKINELYLNRGDGTFEDAGDRLPVDATTNGVVTGDLTGDGAPDILLANNGQNILLVNDGTGRFTDGTKDHLPAIEDVTQDMEPGDVDGDGDLDLIVGNEDRNRLLINQGDGRFTDETEARLPAREGDEETREADFGDVDGDGDLDVLFANVRFFRQSADPANRLLINDGTGTYTDESASRLPRDTTNSADGDFIDLDGDGDLDIITSDVRSVSDPGTGRFSVYENDGTGVFTLATDKVLPETAIGNGFDAEAGDVNGDGLADLFLANRRGADILLLRRATDD